MKIEEGHLNYVTSNINGLMPIMDFVSYYDSLVKKSKSGTLFVVTARQSLCEEENFDEDVSEDYISNINSLFQLNLRYNERVSKVQRQTFVMCLEDEIDEFNQLEYSAWIKEIMMEVKAKLGIKTNILIDTYFTPIQEKINFSKAYDVAMMEISKKKHIECLEMMQIKNDEKFFDLEEFLLLKNSSDHENYMQISFSVKAITDSEEQNEALRSLYYILKEKLRSGDYFTKRKNEFIVIVSDLHQSKLKAFKQRFIDSFFDINNYKDQYKLSIRVMKGRNDDDKKCKNCGL